MTFPLFPALAFSTGLFVVLTFLWLSKGRASNRVDRMLDSAIAVALFVLVFLAGLWALFSYYLRVGFALAFLVAFSRSRRMPAGLLASPPDGGFSIARRIARVGLLLLLLFANGLVAQGFWYPGCAIALAFPLRDGEYCVIQGGNSPVTSFHGRYALDFAKLNASGSRANGVVPAELTDYEIFGEPLYGPCDGVVVEAVDGQPDNRPGEVVDSAGNYVLIDCDGVYVDLVHMMRGSVAVKVGDRLAQGRLVGRVGNSGFSYEPHLHINAFTFEADGERTRLEAVPISFDGRFLSLNSVYVCGAAER